MKNCWDKLAFTDFIFYLYFHEFSSLAKSYLLFPCVYIIEEEDLGFQVDRASSKGTNFVWYSYITFYSLFIFE